VAGQVVAVSRDPEHRFSKTVCDQIRLVANHGVAGDAHAGAMVRQDSRIRDDFAQPNLRQVHLISAELLDELLSLGFEVQPGQLGENITTRGLDLISLPRGTMVRLGESAVVELTGLRKPCRQIDNFRPGLLRAVLDRAEDGSPILKAGVMSTVRTGGVIRPGDLVGITLPAKPHQALHLV
jgi:MOSC domain-containing protein YiiM